MFGNSNVHNRTSMASLESKEFSLFLPLIFKNLIHFICSSQVAVLCVFVFLAYAELVEAATLERREIELSQATRTSEWFHINGFFSRLKKMTSVLMFTINAGLGQPY